MEETKPAKDGGDSLDIKEVRERYDLCVEADEDEYRKWEDDVKFVNVPGAQWEDAQKRKRGSRPCYEFNLLRQHCRQVTGDQRQARPQIKVRAVEDDDADGAEIRQGLVRNIEAQSNADRAYDTAHQHVVEGGYGVWRVITQYSSEDAWEQDIRIKEVPNPLVVRFDPAAMEYDKRDGRFAFYEDQMRREEFKRRFPNAQIVDFESAKEYDDWFREEMVRVVEYWVKKQEKRTIVLLSDGRSVDKAEIEPVLDELEAQGITVVRERETVADKVCMYLCSGAEVLSGPHYWPGKYIPFVPAYGDLLYIDGKWTFGGLARHAKDAARLNNYQMTTAMEAVGKLPKNPYLVTPKMLEGDGVKNFWQKAATEDPLFLPYTPDPAAPGGRPVREASPDFPVAMVNLAGVASDLLKGVTGIHDASLGARSNETSGKAIIARQREGDTATFSYQDNLARSIRYTGEIILDLLPKVYDTPRMVRIIGQDGEEKFKKVNEQVIDAQTGRTFTLNDMSAGKYDVTVTAGPSFSTQRAEFAELMNTLFQGNPQAFPMFGDLFFKSLDVPQAQELSERAKFFLPPQVQQQMQQGKEMPPEVSQAMAQVQAMQQQLQQAAGELQQEKAQVEQEKAQVTAGKSEVQSGLKEIAVKQAALDAHMRELSTRLENQHLKYQLADASKNEAKPNEGNNG